MQDTKLPVQTEQERRPYDKPTLTKWGDLREITAGAGIGTKKDGTGSKAPNTKGPL